MDKQTVWIEEIKKLAMSKYGFTQQGVDHTDWVTYWETYGINGMTPDEALKEDLSCA